MYHYLFTIVPLPKGNVLPPLDPATQEETTISFSETQRIVLDANLKITDVNEMDPNLQDRTVDKYSADGINFVNILRLSDLQSENFQLAVSSGNCVIGLRKNMISGTARGFSQKSFSGSFQFPLLWTN